MIHENVKEITTLYPLIKRKDETAIKEFFILMQPQIFHFLYRYTSIREAAEDLTQESFIKFWLAIDRLDSNQSYKAYLFKIARNLAINYCNRKIPLVSYNDEDLLVRLYKNFTNDIETSFLLDDYQKAINSLPERCKATFLLSRFSSFNYSEIAEIMDVSLQTVKNQMNKALAVLRKRLINHLD
jgi:RNA polymerase sigma-70 factor (ECF subfamily)